MAKALFVFAAAATAAVEADAAEATAAAAAAPYIVSPELVVSRHDSRSSPALPYYLDGRPEHWQARSYGDGMLPAPHTADGPGLTAATTGVPTSFTVRLAGGGGGGVESVGGGSSGASNNHDSNELREWDYNVDKKRFIYVWVASEDHVFTAAVVNNGDGTLTATYESPFPGRYLVHVEDVDLRVRDKLARGRPIVGSPFSLTVTGEPAVRPADLPVCGGDGGDGRDGREVVKLQGEGESVGMAASEFWRTGSWVSANIASERHGVLRDGWMFQPRTCSYEAFSFDDLMLLAGLEEPTWLLALGNSIVRGVFLTLVDMALAQGQKDDLATSALKKCWGWSDVHIGNLRLTYQDLRLYTVTSVEDATVCNDEKLASGSTTAYVRSAELFLRDTVFREGQDWPTVIWAPSNMIDSDEAPNLQISVLMDALPPGWDGTLLMMDHLYGYGFGWNTANPTMTTLAGVQPVNEFSPRTVDSGLARMGRYRMRDSRVTFMSAFPIYQARLWENEFSRVGERCYGCSIHYHFISDSSSSPESYGGAKMVHSAVTETLANIVLAKAVGTKAALHRRAAAAGTTSEEAKAKVEGERRTAAGTPFELCTDCPASLVPLHIKPVPQPRCQTISSLPGNASMGSAWDNELCPDWCLAADPEPDSHAWKGSGLVAVRVCRATDGSGGVGGGRGGSGGSGRASTSAGEGGR